VEHHPQKFNAEELAHKHGAIERNPWSLMTVYRSNVLAAIREAYEKGHHFMPEQEDPKELVKELVAYIRAHVPDPHEPTLFELLQRVNEFTGEADPEAEAAKGNPQY
jgi:hypothetical protein